MTRIAIIETGRPSHEEIKKFGDSPHMFRCYFGDETKFSFVTYPVFQDGKLPGLKDYDAAIITGSSHSVYDDRTWIDPSKEFVREAVARSKPILCVCFGHQLGAEAFGGKVEKSVKGRGIGVHEHSLTEAGRKVFGALPSLRLMAAHQDQVIIPPPSATLLASSPFCEYAAFSYGTACISLQGHPEIMPDFEKVIITRWQQHDPIELHVVEAALASIETPTNATNIRPVLTKLLAGELAL